MVRERLGVDIAQRVFEQVVVLSQEAGVIRSREFYVSAIRGRTDEKLCVIAAWDRSVTTLLLPEASCRRFASQGGVDG